MFFIASMKYFPVISTIKYLEKSWTGPDIYNEAPCPCPVYIWYRIFSRVVLHHIIIPGSSMDPVSREYSCDRDSLQFSKSPLGPVWIMILLFITSWLPQFLSLFTPTKKSPDNFKIQMVKLLLPILGGLRNFSTHIWGPPNVLDY